MSHLRTRKLKTIHGKQASWTGDVFTYSVKRNVKKNLSHHRPSPLSCSWVVAQNVNNLSNAKNKTCRRGTKDNEKLFSVFHFTLPPRNLLNIWEHPPPPFFTRFMNQPRFYVLRFRDNKRGSRRNSSSSFLIPWVLFHGFRWLFFFTVSGTNFFFYYYHYYYFTVSLLFFALPRTPCTIPLHSSSCILIIPVST